MAHLKSEVILLSVDHILAGWFLFTLGEQLFEPFERSLDIRDRSPEVTHQSRSVD
jgi:hypothetical protein